MSNTFDRWAGDRIGIFAPDVERSIQELREEKGWGYRKIAQAMNLGESAVRRYLERLDEIRHPEPQPMTVMVWDLETTNLRADMGTLLVSSFLNIQDGSIITHKLATEGPISHAERDLAEATLGTYLSADILIGHNSKAFDKNFQNGILARNGFRIPERRFHIDTLQVSRHGLKGLLQSYSLENVADFFRVGLKDKPSKHDWREANIRDPQAIDRIAVRCEEDVKLNAVVWDCLKPYWLDWKGTR
jgi:DNA polymerase III epsilon subunit-like protein